MTIDDKIEEAIQEVSGPAMRAFLRAAARLATQMADDDIAVVDLVPVQDALIEIRRCDCGDCS